MSHQHTPQFCKDCSLVFCTCTSDHTDHQLLSTAQAYDSAITNNTDIISATADIHILIEKFTQSVQPFMNFSTQLSNCDTALLTSLEAKGDFDQINKILSTNWKDAFNEGTKEITKYVRRLSIKLSDSNSKTSNIKNKLYGLAESLFQNKKYDQCVEVIELSPNNLGDIVDINLSLLKCNALLFKGNTQRVQSIIENIDPDIISSSPVCLCKYYEILLKLNYVQKQYSKVIDIFESSVKKVDAIQNLAQYSDILVLLARSYYGLKNSESAKQWHSLALDIRSKQYGETHGDTSQSYQYLASIFFDNKDYTNAINYATKALEIRNTVFGFYSTESGQSCYCIANSYIMLNKSTEAIKYLDDSLEIKKKLNGFNCEDVATLSETIASIYMQLNNFTSALKFYKQTLDICNSLYGSRNINTVNAMNNLGFALYYSNDIASAKTMLQDSYNIRELLTSPFDMAVSESELTLGTVLKASGDVNDSIKHLEMSLQIRKSIGQYINIKSATAHSYLGMLYLYKLNYKVAMENYVRYYIITKGIESYDAFGAEVSANNTQEIQKVLINEANKIKKQCTVVEEGHIANLIISVISIVFQQYDTALCYLNKSTTSNFFKNDFIEYCAIINAIGQCFILKGDTDKASAQFKLSYDMIVTNLGKEHLETFYYYNNTASICLIKGDNAGALKNYTTALAIKAKFYPPNHSELGGAYNNIALAFQRKGDKESAVKNYLHALDIFKKNAETSLEISTINLNLGNLYAERNELNNALAYLQKSLEIRVNILGKYSAEVGNSHIRIGNLYMSKQSYDNALSCFNTAAEIYTKIYPVDNVDTAFLYFNMGMLHKLTNKRDLALVYFDKAYNVQKRLLGENNEATRRTYKEMR